MVVTGKKRPPGENEATEGPSSLTCDVGSPWAMSTIGRCNHWREFPVHTLYRFPSAQRAFTLPIQVQQEQLVSIKGQTWYVNRNNRQGEDYSH